MREFFLGSVGRLDLVVWLLVIGFFCGSALLFHGNIQMAFIGSSGIILEMMIIGLSIEIIIESLKTTRGIGTITGFITNGPEAICLIVGLAVGDVIFAASTPLGSNFMNPVLLTSAAILCNQLVKTFNTSRTYAIITIAITGLLAITFFLLNVEAYVYWVAISLVVTVILFFFRPVENEVNPEDEESGEHQIDNWLIPAIIILSGSGYFLDPVVNFAALHSHTPKGVIGFLVLATLTSWPEFKSCLSLIKRGKNLAAILNITVSNITNIWLALAGISFYLFQK